MGNPAYLMHSLYLLTVVGEEGRHLSAFLHPYQETFFLPLLHLPTIHLVLQLSSCVALRELSQLQALLSSPISGHLRSGGTFTERVKLRHRHRGGGRAQQNHLPSLPVLSRGASPLETRSQPPPGL